MPFSRWHSWNTAGNFTDDGTISYTYGANGRMETASSAGVTTRYRYNGRGERVVKTSSSRTTYYVYDEQGRLLGEYDSTGTAIQETIYLDDLPVAVITPGATGPVVYYVYADHLNTPRVLIRASDNQIVWRWDNADPFGLIQPDENPSGFGTFSYNLRFPGQVFDKETNNHYNYFRDYDPQTGRYIQSDPIGLYGGLNTYAYVGGNPLVRIDPKGLDVCFYSIIRGQWCVGKPPLVDPELQPLPAGPKAASWEDDLDFADHGPKNEYQFLRCKTPEDRECRDRLIFLKAWYMKLKLLQILGTNDMPGISNYNEAAQRYNVECPYWEKVPLFK